jgi:hypothetical protein
MFCEGEQEFWKRMLNIMRILLMLRQCEDEEMAKKASLKVRRRTRKAAAKATKTAKLGSGERFAAVEAAAKAGGAEDPGAVAAMAGRKKFGAKKMGKMAVAGKKRKARGKK